MIPLHLKLSGFLSYRNPVEIDFTSFELACISGQNGAGKSSLLDAITWVLFGQARKRDDTLVNSASDSAEIVFVFYYEENTYRVQRILTRGKSTLLEFQIQDHQRWRPLTEASLRATQARIETILRLDYDTFVNASFFLQGKADQFTQQRPSDRKRILASILGLELWEGYRERTAERRKLIENDLNNLDGRLAEINSELGEEAQRKMRLKELETELVQLQETRKTQETIMASIKQTINSLQHQQTLAEKLNQQITRNENELSRVLSRQFERLTERERHSAIVSKAAIIETEHKQWQQARAELETWNALAENFREQEKVRQEPLAVIRSEQARLEHERDRLLRSEIETEKRAQQLSQLELALQAVRNSLIELEDKLKLRVQLEKSQTIIARFREQARLRQTPLAEISSEKARLEQELKALEKQYELIETQQSALIKLRGELENAQLRRIQAETQLDSRKTLEQDIQAKKEARSLLKNGNERLKLEMETLDERIKKLEITAGAVCPLCGQPLSAAERQGLIENLRSDGKQKGDEFRKNKADLDELLREIPLREKEILAFAQVEKDYLTHVTTVTKISERIEANNLSIADWEKQGMPRRAEIQSLLINDNFSQAARQQLARIDRELHAIGKALGIKTAKEQSIFDIVEEKVIEIETELNTLKGFEQEHLQKSAHNAQLSEQTKALRAAIEGWNTSEKPLLAEIIKTLNDENFSLQERKKLAEIDDHLKSIGYDPALHDKARQAELEGRSSENNLRELESARAALVPLERELADIEKQVQTQQLELEQLKGDYESAQAALNELQAQTPDALIAETALLHAQERENIVTRDVGAAQQKVKVLQDLRLRKTHFESQREELGKLIKNHKILERAFGKDGVPSLLIEQALPQIEEKANELLDRLSNGTMSVRFVTQAEYRDKKRDDLKETLDIQISDGAGTRDYEMFSGGEAFRVNFAIRLALSEILARRTGARLQTLVIDEGFGSQDNQGRQRLIEAINLVKGDFAKILIITHLEELKEAFPNRIEVEKTPQGSSARVL